MRPSPIVPSPGLVEVLERARRLGVLGPGPVLDHVAHAGGFVLALEGVASGSTVLDLGSGGGVPGLVVAEARPDLQVVLLDSLERRVALLDEAIGALGWSGRVRTLEARAEDVGRSPDWRGAVDVVTARSFGPPAVAAECAAPLLRLGGILIVSEPPEDLDRWPAEGVERLGLVNQDGAPPGLHLCRQARPCPREFPRRVGLPAKRPLF